MKRPAPYPTELREGAVRVVFEHTPGYTSQWATISSASAKVGVHAKAFRS